MIKIEESRVMNRFRKGDKVKWTWQPFDSKYKTELFYYAGIDNMGSMVFVAVNRNDDTVYSYHPNEIKEFVEEEIITKT